MKKSLLFLTFAAGMAFCANAQDVTYNFFDPADCDADGWLWLDTQEKIDKYVGNSPTDGKKILLIDAQYEVQDPDFPDDTFYPQSRADVDAKGYNTEGVQGGEGSKTGALVLPAASYDPDEDWWATDGGGFLVSMPDCAIFDIYVSQEQPDVYTEIYAAREQTSNPGDCEYVYDDEPYYDWSNDTYVGGPVITSYAGAYTNMQAYEYDYDYGEGNPDIYSIYGAKGEARTAYIANYASDVNPPCILYVHGFRIRTYTSVSADNVGEAGVESIAQDSLKVSVKGGVVQLSSPAQIAVYSPSGAKVAGGYGSSLDCSALKGIYFVKAGNKTVKAVF